MGHLEKHDALSPHPPPPKIPWKREKSEKNNKICNFLSNLLYVHIADFHKNCRFCCFFHFFRVFKVFLAGWGREGRERRVFPGGPCWSQTICNTVVVIVCCVINTTSSRLIYLKIKHRGKQRRNGGRILLINFLTKRTQQKGAARDQLLQNIF